MKYIYISELDEKGVGFGDYSRAFYRVLEQFSRVHNIDLLHINVHGSQHISEKCHAEISRKLKNLVSEDIVHIEICRKDSVRWTVLESLIRDIETKPSIHLTIHDPPEVVASLIKSKTLDKLRIQLGLRKYIQKIFRLSFLGSNRIRKTLAKVDRSYSLTAAGTNCLIKKYNLEPSKVRTIPHVIYNTKNESSRRFLTPTKSIPIIGFMGTWWKHKGIEFMFDELIKLARSGIKFAFVIAGLSFNSRYQSYVLKRVNELKKLIPVTNYGELKSTEFAQFAGQCDILVLPHKNGTKIQGSGILMRGLEAGACIMTSDAIGVFDDVRLNSTVANFSWADKASFSKVILELLEDSKLRQKLRNSTQNFLNSNHSDEIILNNISN